MNKEILIEKYFAKSLSKNELLEFQKLYETNAQFKQEIDFLKDVKFVSEKEDDLQFKRQLVAYEVEFNKKSQYAKWLKPLTAVAAILLIALSISFIFNGSINEDKLFISYFEPSKNVSIPIVRHENDETILNKAFIAYGETDYEKAIPLFENAFDITENSELLFYQGNALLAIGKTKEAIKKFEEHLTFSDVLTNRSHWYLALAYLKTKQIEKAKQHLIALINSGESYKREESSSLLKKLE